MSKAQSTVRILLDRVSGGFELTCMESIMLAAAFAEIDEATR